MVLERPMPCQSLDDFVHSYTSTLDEDLARVIMRQATFAAQKCCHRGVFHRDIKLQNLLINPDTLEVKLIDFGCGETLTYAGYTSYSGTEEFSARGAVDRWQVSQGTSNSVVTWDAHVCNAVRGFSMGTRTGQDHER